MKFHTFLDTTPIWSVRGKFRIDILPILFNTFSGSAALKKNLLSITKESEEWGTLIQSRFIDKYYSLINFDKNIVEMPIKIEDEDYSEFPMCFWNIIFGKIFHKFGKNAPSRKSIEIFMMCLKDRDDVQIILKHGTKLILNNKTIKIIFIS